jgi:Zn-dependent protease/CBS domain-containing protein
MSWSLRLGRVLGVELSVHVTFFLLLLWAALAGAHGGLAGVTFNVTFILLLFVCVTLHELGHAEVAQRHGVPVHQIILLPIGGLAVLGRNPKTPREELVNVIIALGMALGFLLAGHFGKMDLEAMVRNANHPTFALLIERLFEANVALALFNLIPAFPMDGGRILRGILGLYVPMTRATRIATGVSQIVAIGLFVWAIYAQSLLLALIAGFVFFAAGAERTGNQAGTVLATRRVGDAYNRYAILLSLNDRVSQVVDYLLKSYQPDFAVVHRGQLQGIVTRQDVIRWLSHNTYDVFVTEIMEEPTRLLKVPADASLDDVRQRMTESQHRVAAVYEGDAFLGLVSAEDIAEAMYILTFLNKATGGGGQYSTARRVAEGSQGAPTTQVM